MDDDVLTDTKKERSGTLFIISRIPDDIAHNVILANEVSKCLI